VFLPVFLLFSYDSKQSCFFSALIKEGDIINNVNGVPVNSVTELQEQIGRYRPGDKIIVTVVRKDSEEKLSVELRNREGNTGLVSSDNNIDVLGATYKEVSDKTRQQLGLDYGLEIKSLSKGKFADAGIKPGFVILKINNQAIRTEDDIKTAYDAAINNGDPEKVFYIAGVYANGKITYYAVNLEDEK
jgi:serine protease Do